MSALNVTVGFSTTNKLTSRIIRWATRSPCSHAWFAFDDETLGMRMVMQAEWWGYEVRPWKRWRGDNILVAEFEPAELELGPSVKFMAQELGTRYDYGAAAWVGVKGWVQRWFHSRLSVRPSRTPHQLMCSEAVVRLLMHAGYQFSPGLDPELVSPGDLLGILQKSAQFLQRLNKVA